MGTRVLNLDDVGMSGELHDRVKKNRLMLMHLSTQSFIVDT